MSFFKKKSGVTVIIVLIAAVLISLFSRATGVNPVSSVVKTLTLPLRSGVAYISGKIEDTVNFIWEASEYKEQNDLLIAEITELKKKNKESYAYQTEIERLNSLLELQNSMNGYSTVAARIIGYSHNGQCDKLEISKGTASGISEGNTVITNEGIVGIVTDAGLSWSVVDTIIAPGSATGIRVSRTGDVGVIEGDSELYSNLKCKLTFIGDKSNIIVGDILETSGNGGIFPAGMTVGTIREIRADNMGTLDYAVVEPAVDFSKIKEVLVINGVSAQ